MIYLIALISVALIVSPLFFIHRRVKNGKKGKMPFVAQLCSFFGIMLVATIMCLGNGVMAASDVTAAADSASGIATGMGYIGAALAVGLSGIGGGIAVSAAASSALGAISENEKIFGKSLIFVGLAEGVALYGLLVAFLIIFSL